MCGPSLSLNQSSAHPQSSEPQGGHAFEEGDSSRRVEVAPWVGSNDLDSLRGSGGGSVRHELENAHCLLFFSLSHSPLKGDALTSHWPAARLYIYKKKKKKRCFGDTHRPELADPAWFPDQTELLVASPLPIPVRKDLLSQMSGPGWLPNPELWSLHVWLLRGYQRSWVPCILVYSTCSRRRGHPLRGICMLWNGECLGNSAVMFISTQLLAPCWMFCFFYGTDWIVDLYYQHWKYTWPLLPCFVPRWAGNRLVGTRWWWVFL